MKPAIRGGTALRNVKERPWPSWPVWDERDRQRLIEVLESGVWSYSGPKETEAIDALKDFFGVPYALLASNGTVTLQLALEALDVGYGDEVIVPALTWQATAAAVLDVNAVPILVDVDPNTWCMDPAATEAAITERTAAIIPVHLYGAMANMDEILQIAGKHGLPVVEDTAHQHGSEWRDQKAGTLGTIGSFSLQLSKALTAGEGGILVTREEELWMKLDALRNCGRRPEGYQAEVDKGSGQYGSEGDLIQSGNYRITDFQAAMLVSALERLPEQNERREENGRYLDEQLSQIEGLTPIAPHDAQSRRTYFNYAFRYDESTFGGGGIRTDMFRSALSQELGIGFEACYEPLTDCSLYRPQTKRRYKLSEDHWKSIDPGRFEVPTAVDIYENRSVVVHHRILLGARDDMDEIVAAVRKLESGAEALKAESQGMAP